MKSTLTFALLIINFAIACAQGEQVLPVDERGKFIHYEVVEMKNIAKDLLKTRALNYLKSKSSGLKYKDAQGDTAFTASGKFIISKTLLVMSHPSGEILYHFQVEAKEGKYRFWLSDFSFIPYQRDRYGNFVATTTVGTPLEESPGKLNAGQWKEYQVQTATFANDFALKFKNFMASKSVTVPAPEKKVISKSW